MHLLIKPLLLGPLSTTLASPLIVAEIELRAEVFKFCSRDARLDGACSGSGEPERRRAVVVGGRGDTQSCTSRETCGFERRLRVFFGGGRGGHYDCGRGGVGGGGEVGVVH